jgi:hypothetical protein
MPNEWFYIQQTRRKDEQSRDVGRNRIRFNNDRFTLPDGVPIVPVNDEEDDFDEEEK